MGQVMERRTMKKAVLLSAVLITAAGCADRESGMISFAVPADVVHEYKANLEFHSFHWGANDNTAVFMLHPHPAGLSPSMVQGMADKTAAQLESQLKMIEGVESVSRKATNIAAGHFSGKEIDFTVMTTDGKSFYQCVYVLWDGDRVWQGQLTGAKDTDIGVARKLLQTAQK